MLTRRMVDRRLPYAAFDDGWRIFDSMQRIFEDLDRGFGGPSFQVSASVTPRVDLVDAGSELRLYAELPGFSEDDVEMTLESGRITLRGRRETDVPEGYHVRRRERGDLSFVRSLALPCRVDADGVSARLQNGILQVTLPKSAEAQPRQIPIRRA